MFGQRLLTVHNIAFYQHLMRRIRSTIVSGDAAAWNTLLADAERASQLAPADA
jgi:queuine/archaeosine tRNA-ribosyltransferase